MVQLIHIAEAAPQFQKTEAAFRWWLAQPSCPIKAAKIGGRLMLRQEDIDAYIESAFSEAS